MEPAYKRLIVLILINLALIFIIVSRTDIGNVSRTSRETSYTTDNNRDKKTNKKTESALRRTLPNGSEPYATWYGYNQGYNPDRLQSTIEVTSSVSQDVVVIVKYNDKYGDVAGHIYIQAGKSGKIYVSPGYTYQVFFYFGDDWDSDKIMNGTVRGGFTRNETTSEDASSHYFAIHEYYDEITWDGGIEYNLNPVRNGNFQTKKCTINDVF